MLDRSLNAPVVLLKKKLIKTCNTSKKLYSSVMDVHRNPTSTLTKIQQHCSNYSIVNRLVETNQ